MMRTVHCKLRRIEQVSFLRHWRPQRGAFFVVLPPLMVGWLSKV